MTDQFAVTAVTAAVVILAILAIVSIVPVVRGRRYQQPVFGAGGTTKVPVGTAGVARTMVAQSGVVNAAGEDWTARSVGDLPIAAGERVRVVGHDGLTLMVEPEPAGGPAGN